VELARSRQEENDQSMPEKPKFLEEIISYFVLQSLSVLIIRKLATTS